ncbi:MAG: hypothetical protein ACI8Q6_004014, partial [Granulosicoccus sp.]
HQNRKEKSAPILEVSTLFSFLSLTTLHNLDAISGAPKSSA